jgi:hypothetical protein
VAANGRVGDTQRGNPWNCSASLQQVTGLIDRIS